MSAERCTPSPDERAERLLHRTASAKHRCRHAEHRSPSRPRRWHEPLDEAEAHPITIITPIVAAARASPVRIEIVGEKREEQHSSNRCRRSR